MLRPRLNLQVTSEEFLLLTQSVAIRRTVIVVASG
jgi:hypothetical protein